MKIGIVGDIHFSEYSSILRTKGEKYSTRLENCLESIKWAENLFSNTCDAVIYLGDFFDKSSLTASELTAFSDIVFNSLPHSFLVGNHEMGINNLTFSSAHVLNCEHESYVIDKCCLYDYSKLYEGADFEIGYLPYILEENRKESIKNYFGEKTKKRIIFSHNDIAGIQLGKFISKAGFNIKDIEANCDLFINGHLHNGSKITDKIINIGNLTGQNFSENAFVYKHNVMILDTDSLSYKLYENPYAINFYKISDISEINNISNAVVTIKTDSNNVAAIRNRLNSSNNIITYKVIVEHTSSDINSISDLSIDHLEEFKNFVLREIGNSNLVLEELSIING